MKNGIFIYSFMICSIYLSTSLFALPSYFKPNTIEDIFDTQTSVSEQEDFVLLRAKKAKQLKIDKKIKTPEKQIEANPEIDDLPLEDRLEQKYGDPLKDFPVTAVDNSPAPFKGMIEALYEGDKELAFKYAVQYVKYRRALKDINASAVSLVGQGNVRIGQLPEDSWASGPAYKEDVYLRDLEFEEKIEEEEELPSGRQITIDEKAKKILARAKDAGFDLFNSSEIPKIDSKNLGLDEDTERKRARREMARRLPVDPKGKVDIYFFFDPNDKVAKGIAPDIQQLYKLSKKDKNLNFIAFTTRRLKKNEINSFHETSKTDFPVISGADLSKELKIKVSPSTVLFAQTSAKSFMKEGPESFYYIHEMSKIMQGK